MPELPSNSGHDRFPGKVPTLIQASTVWAALPATSGVPVGLVRRFAWVRTSSVPSKSSAVSPPAKVVARPTTWSKALMPLATLFVSSGTLNNGRMIPPFTIIARRRLSVAETEPT